MAALRGPARNLSFIMRLARAHIKTARDESHGLHVGKPDKSDISGGVSIRLLPYKTPTQKLKNINAAV